MTAPVAPPSLPFTRAERFRRYWLKDHGVLRAVWTNFHKLDEDVWRHNHPSPARLARLKAMGAQSILTLRGSDSFPSRIEAVAAAQVGLNFHALEMRAHKLPRAEVLQELLAAMRALPKPLVVHCKSGSDRTGLASTLYLHVIKGVPLDEARGQLALRYVHNRRGRAGVVHHLLDAYAASGMEFEDWLRNGYDRDALMAEFTAKQ